MRICIDFRDLNKATPKDDYPLPSIDLLVDSTAGTCHVLLSWTDIPATIRLSWPPATNQKLPSLRLGALSATQLCLLGSRMLEQPISEQWSLSFTIRCAKIMDVYVDDILVKSKEEEDHLEALDQVFKRLILYKLRLNPQKCVFEVELGKLLGFLVSKKGIEVDLAKAKAIIDMPPPTSLKELRSLQGRMQSIRRFISNLAMRCEPFNHLLRKGVKFEWGPECQQSFDRIKKYLLNPPILKPPELGKPLLLYISVNQVACGGFLAQYTRRQLDRARHLLCE